MLPLSFKGKVHFKTFFAGSDAEYVVMTIDFFSDAQTSKTTKLSAFKVFSGICLGRPGLRLDRPGLFSKARKV